MLYFISFHYIMETVPVAFTWNCLFLCLGFLWNGKFFFFFSHHSNSKKDHPTVPGWGGGGVKKGLAGQKHNNYRKEPSASFSQKSAERSRCSGGVKECKQWEAVSLQGWWNNNGTRTLDPAPAPALIRGDDVRGRRLSRGSARERGKVLRAWGFPAPHCLPDNLSSPENED